VPDAPTEHLSIGEVLATLRDEFPDITISKIRFLESQGLIDPERTPSGYRKFYSDDIDRLRWILHQQKEHFLPLKVIKGRLDDAPQGALPTESEAPDGTGEAPQPTEEPTPARATRSARGTKGGTRAASRRRRVTTTPPLPLDAGEPEHLDPDDDDAGVTRAELAEEAELTLAQVTELEEYGLIHPEPGTSDPVRYGAGALEVARLSAAFRRHGIEARHLRMYRAFADRESGLFGQVVQPVLRQRNPEARARAREDLVELARLGRELRTAFLRDALRDLLAD